ncbi:retrovirus-related pol polyprotein from transposon TNT 1-94 [Tanacetum coccineum]
MAQATPTTSLPPLSTSQPQPAVLSPNDAMMATITQIANLLSGFQKQFPPTNNQLIPFSNTDTSIGKKVICYNCRGEGHVARQCKRTKDKRRILSTSKINAAYGSKAKGVTLDAAS